LPVAHQRRRRRSGWRVSSATAGRVKRFILPPRRGPSVGTCPSEAGVLPVP
jgi:hypothetical protein